MELLKYFGESNHMKRFFVYIISLFIVGSIVSSVHAQTSDEWWLNPSNQTATTGSTTQSGIGGGPPPVTADVNPTIIFSVFGTLLMGIGISLQRIGNHQRR
jgi:uncharacterized membrane-anchored protein YitT (DUF2179 family)